jgi:phosphatidylglycerophosphate synthase
MGDQIGRPGQKLLIQIERAVHIYQERTAGKQSLARHGGSIPEAPSRRNSSPQKAEELAKARPERQNSRPRHLESVAAARLVEQTLDFKAGPRIVSPMSERLAIVRHRGGLPPGTRVGGIPLAIRHVRTAGRAGIAEVLFVVDDPLARQEIAEVLQSWPATEGVESQVVEKPEAHDGRDVVELEYSAIYAVESLNSASPAADFRIADRSDLKGARAYLFGKIRKSVALDGAISYYVMRPLARILTHVLLNTRVSPNAVTLMALACGLAAAVFAGLGGAHNAVWAGLLYWSGGIIDHVDGELARLRMQSSKAGEWLDSMTDETSTFTLLIGLGVGLHLDGHSEDWMWLGMIGSLAGSLAVARLYIDLHRMGLPIDTAQFPWFFNKEPTREGASARGNLLEALGFILRRDANVTIVSILVLLNQRIAAECIIAGATVMGVLLVLTHYTVVTLRGKKA